MTRKVGETEDVIKLAALLNKYLDEKCIWDSAIDLVKDATMSDAEVVLFKNKKEDYQEIRKKLDDKRKIYNSECLVSKRILEDGYKPGYIYRTKPHNNYDSGWCFLAGNESDEYNDDIKNMAIIHIFDICKIDPDIDKYITMPIGTNMIRISSHEFEIDKRDKPIFIEKWK